MARVLYTRGRALDDRRRPRRRSKGRLWIALVIAAVSIVSFLMTRSKNPITGQTQYVAMSVQDEIALGLAAAPEMAAQHGGLHPDPEAQALVDAVGERLLVQGLAMETPYEFEFHLLADPQTVNAFALPGGQVFITAALQLTQGLVGAVGVAASEEGRGAQAAAVAAAIGQLVNMSYGREDELECDRWGVKLMVSAGYDPRAQIRVMEILRDAGGGAGPPEFFSTHPNPDNRIDRIERAIAEEFPNGVPEGLEP